MRLCVLAATLLHFTVSAMAGDDPMVTRYGNTTIALDPDGTITRISYRPDHSFVAQQATWQSDGSWAIKDGKLCLTYKTARPNSGSQECLAADHHNIGDVWFNGPRHVTLIKGEVLSDTPEELAALAAASRVGNTVVAKDPDGTETRLFWRPDHSFSAVRPGWKTEGTWRVDGASLFLHYDIARPNMGSDEEMKNATPRKVGEVWGMADRKVILLAGNQLIAPN